MIEDIQISNFRGIKKGYVDKFKKINILVGPNNSGKSAILEAIYLASTVNKESKEILLGHYDQKVRIADRDFFDEYPIKRIKLRHNIADTNNSSENWVNKQVISNPTDITRLWITLKILKPGAPLKDITLLSDKVETFNILKNEEPYISLFQMDVNNVKREPGVNKPASLIDRMMGSRINSFDNKRITYCWEQDLTYNHIGGAAWTIKGELPFSRYSLFYDVKSTLSHLPFGFYQKMIKVIPGWGYKIGDSFRRIFNIDNPIDVQFLPTNEDLQGVQAFIAPRDAPPVSIDSYGDGARSIFKVLVPFIALNEMISKNSQGLFIWEEPELFQNPKTLSKAIEEIVFLIKDKPIQIFLVTHSLEVIANFALLVKEGKLDEKELMAFRVNLKEGELKSSWFDSNNLITWLDNGLDPRLWEDFKPPLNFSFRSDEGGGEE